MKNTNLNNTEKVMKEKEWYKKKIVEMTKDIENVWILQEIVRFIENIQK